MSEHPLYDLLRESAERKRDPRVSPLAVVLTFVALYLLLLLWGLF